MKYKNNSFFSTLFPRNLKHTNTIIMKNIPYDYIYLGFALSCFADLHFFTWQFYAILAPFTLLETYRNRNK